MPNIKRVALTDREVTLVADLLQSAMIDYDDNHHDSDSSRGLDVTLDGHGSSRWRRRLDMNMLIRRITAVEDSSVEAEDLLNDPPSRDKPLGSNDFYAFKVSLGNQFSYYSYLPATPAITAYLFTHRRRKADDALLNELTYNVYAGFSEATLRQVLNMNNAGMAFNNNEQSLILTKAKVLGALALRVHPDDMVFLAEHVDSSARDSQDPAAARDAALISGAARGSALIEENLPERLRARLRGEREGTPNASASGRGSGFRRPPTRRFGRMDEWGNLQDFDDSNYDGYYDDEDDDGEDARPFAPRPVPRPSREVPVVDLRNARVFDCNTRDRSLPDAINPQFSELHSAIVQRSEHWQVSHRPGFNSRTSRSRYF